MNDRNNTFFDVAKSCIQSIIFENMIIYVLNVAICMRGCVCVYVCVVAVCTLECFFPVIVASSVVRKNVTITKCMAFNLFFFQIHFSMLLL